MSQTLIDGKDVVYWYRRWQLQEPAAKRAMMLECEVTRLRTESQESPAAREAQRISGQATKQLGDTVRELLLERELHKETGVSLATATQRAEQAELELVEMDGKLAELQEKLRVTTEKLVVTTRQRDRARGETTVPEKNERERPGVQGLRRVLERNGMLPEEVDDLFVMLQEGQLRVGYDVASATYDVEWHLRVGEGDDGVN